MKIGFVFDDSLDFPDGVQQYLLSLGRELTAQGHEVHYLVGETHRTDIPNVHSLSRNVKVRFNGNVMRIPLPSKKSAIRQVLKHEQFDVLHVSAPYSPFLAGRIIKAAKSPSTGLMNPPRIVSTFLIAPAGRAVMSANYGLGLLTNGSMKHVDQHVALSPVAQDLARKAYRVPTTIIPSPIDVASYQDAEPINGPTGRKRILFLGRLVERKGCDKLLDAIAYCETQPGFGNVEVVVAGDGPLRTKIEEQARSLRTPVEFLGFIEEGDKAGLLKGADVVAFASTGAESFGIVLIEAMAAGSKVVLAGDNPGYRSTMASNEDLLVNVHDAEEFGKRILRALTDEEFASRADSWQQNHVQQFATPTVLARILEVYRG